ncbi:hypothetical protein REPUB_Repub01dG0073900 [Reevesia pubescens]
MGNCVTAYKNKDPEAMNLSAQIQSTTKENFVKREQHSIAELGSRSQSSSMEQAETSFRDFSKTEENFFDSQPWLESDCEDFFSVNGDSTSSCGNSPNHPKSFTDSSQRDKNPSMDRAQDSAPEHSPTDTKKLLIELFRESFDHDVASNDPSSNEQLEDKTTTFNLPPNSTSRSPYESFPNSVRSSETTPYRGYLPRKEKSAQSVQCCLPRLVRNMSFGERKKRLSPTKTDGW